MRLTVLGSGSAFSSVGGNAAYCLDSRLLIDCGAPVHTIGRAAGVDPAAIRTVLLTHFHFDHCGQLVMLLGTRALATDPITPLTLAGPVGTREYVMRLVQTGQGSHLRNLVDELLKPDSVVLQDGTDMTIDGFRVRARAVVHSTGPSLAYAITGADGVTVGFSGDSTDCAGLRDVVAMSDLMVCECTSWDGPVPTHLWAGEVRTLMAEHPDTRFLVSHLTQRRSMPGALIAHDRLSLDVQRPGTPRPQPPPTIASP
jgi:ribonuclease BN (tRNA processing enzyme)